MNAILVKYRIKAYETHHYWLLVELIHCHRMKCTQVYPIETRLEPVETHTSPLTDSLTPVTYIHTVIFNTIYNTPGQTACFLDFK